ncbi:hypothetical protein N0V90_010889 [Kalmusia sp. IMI 367209]|nr:hypothetical protein N0V90_010889 [Kalmusia sp. IMI 367209]
MSWPARGAGRFPLQQYKPANKNSADTNGASSTGAGTSSLGAFDKSRMPDTPFAPSPKEARGSSHRLTKRSATALSPADGPADKRPRVTTSSDRNQTPVVDSSIKPFDSSQSRRNSTSRQNSIDRPSPASLTAQTKKGRHVEQENPSQSRKSLKKLSTSFRGSNGSASPSPHSMMHGDSGQIGSGTSTPVRGAPPAPPMVLGSGSVTNPDVDNKYPRSIASLRTAAALTKQIKPASSSEKSIAAQLQAKNLQLQALQEEINNGKTWQLQLEERLVKLESQTPSIDTGLSDSMKQMKEISQKVRQLEDLPRPDLLTDERAIRTLKDYIDQSIRQSLQEGVTAAEAILAEVKTVALESRLDKTCIDRLRKDMSSVQKDTETLKKADLSQRLSSLETAVKSQEQHTAQKLNIINEQLEKQDTDVRILTAFMETTKKENPPLQLSSLQKKFRDQKQDTTEKLRDIDKQLERHQTEMNSVTSSIENIKQTHLSEQLSNLEKRFGTQEQDTTRKLAAIETQLEQQSVAVDHEMLKKGLAQLEGDARLELENNTKRINTTIDSQRAELKNVIEVYINNATQLIKQDMGKDMAEIRKANDDAQIKFDSAMNDVRTEHNHLRNQVDLLDRRGTSAAPSGALELQPQEPKQDLQSKIDTLAAKVVEIDIVAETAREEVDVFSKTLINRFNEVVETRLEPIKQNIREIREQDPTHNQPVDLRNVVAKQESLTNALQSLEDRFYNITTESIFQQMVHCITQNYPNAPGFLSALNRLASRVDNTEKHIKSESQARSDEIQRIRVESGSEYGSREALGNLRTKHDDLHALVISLTEKFDVLKNSMEPLKEAKRVLDTSIGNLATRVETTESLGIKHAGELQSIHSALDALVTLDLEQLRDLGAQFPQIILTLAEHEHNIMTVNNNHRGGGVRLTWSYGLSSIYEEHFAKEMHRGTDKGKEH